MMKKIAGILAALLLFMALSSCSGPFVDPGASAITTGGGLGGGFGYEDDHDHDYDYDDDDDDDDDDDYYYGDWVNYYPYW